MLPPPKSIQVFATGRRKLTVQWEQPDEIQVDNVIMKYQMILRVILQDHLGKCSTSVNMKYFCVKKIVVQVYASLADITITHNNPPPSLRQIVKITATVD